jgi:DHA2 family multidrug resistance protein
MNAQVVALATADIYRVLGTLALVLVPLALMMQFIPAPSSTQQKPPQLSPSNG